MQPTAATATEAPTFSTTSVQFGLETFCSAHSKCPNFNIPCCPTANSGTFLKCCDSMEDDDIEAALPTGTPTQLPTISPTAVPIGANQDSPSDGEQPLWGSNVHMIDESWTTPQIQQLFDTVFQKQVNNEMGEERYGIYFKPGVYGSANEPLMVQVGYYTEVAGLGKNPDDVVVYGKIEVYNRCFDPILFEEEGKFVPYDGSGHCIALNNFWRSLSNLSVHIISRDQDSCRATANFWAVSQASSMRRVSFVNGDVSLMDYCTMPAFASGGFLADSKFSGGVENGSQQQWISRNINVKRSWTGSVWNQVFLGSFGVPPGRESFPDPPISTMDLTPVSREKPYLYLGEDEQFYIFLPSAVTNSRGPSWDKGTPGRSIPLDELLVVTSTTTAGAINQALSSGRHLLFTPGVYDIYETIEITKPGTVVLGMGHATLTARGGAVAIKTSNAPGIVLAGITIDAGEAESPYLLQVGSKSDKFQPNEPADPITLSDFYIRVGGPHIGKTTVAIEINSDNALIDHAWIWRADHGKFRQISIDQSTWVVF